MELWSTYVNQPFSVPLAFQVENLLALALGRKEANEDHLWLLQTDPRYLRRFIKTAVDGSITSQLKDLKEKEPARYLSSAVTICEEMEDHLPWLWLLEEWGNMVKLSERFKGNVHRGEQVPSPYSEALGSLHTLLHHLMNL